MKIGCLRLIRKANGTGIKQDFIFFQEMKEIVVRTCFLFAQSHINAMATFIWFKMCAQDFPKLLSRITLQHVGELCQ